MSLPPDDPGIDIELLSAAETLLDSAEPALRARATLRHNAPPINEIPSLEALKAAPPQLRIAAATLVLDRPWDKDAISHDSRLLELLMARKMELPAPLGVHWMLGLVARSEHDPHGAGRLTEAVLKRVVATADSPEGDLATVGAAAEAIAHGLVGARWHRSPLLPRLRELALQAQLATGPEVPLALLHPDDGVGRRISAVLQTSSAEARAVLGDALRLFLTAPRGPLTADWRAQAEQLATQLAEPNAFAGALLDALNEAPEFVAPRTGLCWIHADNEPIAVGAVRFAGITQHAALLPQLVKLVHHTVAGLAGRREYPRSVRVANAAASAIAELDAPDAIVELLALEQSVRHGLVLQHLRRLIDEHAKARGVTREQLAEQTVERHGLEPDGTRDEALSQGSLRITVTGRAVGLSYVGADGRQRASFPAAVREADSIAIAIARKAIKTIRGTLSAERRRIDALFASGASWQIKQWRTHYLEHPVTGRITEQLIWRFAPKAGTELVGVPSPNGQLTDVDGTEHALPTDGTVRLWHPVEATDSEAGAWRQSTIERELTQPVRQAFREIYRLSKAEQSSSSASQRFSGHHIRQPQARALWRERGWRSSALAWWDEGENGSAHRDYAHAGLRVEFAYRAITDLDEGGEVHPLVTTGELQFTAAVAGERQRVAVPLADVPALLFSEAMRDTDLVVSVSSIAGDGGWPEHGVANDRAELRAYWELVAHGALGPSARLRREVVHALIPGLPGAECFSLEGSWLRVRGTLGEYRIHLGSGSTLVDATSNHLVIAAPAGRRAAARYLPIEDDSILTQIIANALVLAADDTISDPELLSQIRRT